MSILDPKQISAFSPSLFFGNENPHLDSIVQNIFNEIYQPVARRIPVPYFLDRLASGIFYRVPQLLGLGRDLSQMNVLEIGCGRGLKSVPWSTLFRRYWGVDIIADDIAFAKGAAASTGRKNLEFIFANAVEVMRDPKRFGIDEKIDCIIMYAVVEHLTLAERREVLGSIRDMLADGGVLIVSETPNRLIPHDGHSTYLHFFQALPPELALAYIDRSPRGDAKAVPNGADPVEELYRFGMGASFHEFELFMADSEGKLPAITRDGWNFWQVFDEPIRRDELAMADYFRVHGDLAQPAFARFWIEAVFEFGRPAEAALHPRFFAPVGGGDVTVRSRPQCWTVDLTICNEGGRLDFNIGDIQNPLLQFDITESSGAFAIFDANDNQVAEYSMEALSTARLPRWHSRCAINLTQFGDLGEFSIRPVGSGSVLAVEGIIGKARGA